MQSVRRMASEQLNAHIYAPHICMYTINSVLGTLEKGDYAFKIDLQDEYFHVLIHPDSSKYLRFAFENKVYHLQVLPLSLNTVPQVFTCLGTQWQLTSIVRGYQ